MSDAQHNDSQLIQQTLDGSHDAFRELVIRYQSAVFAVAYGILLSTHDASDATQEAFIRFHRNLDLFDPARPVKPYLTTIAANVAKDTLRQQSRRRESSTEDTDIAALPLTDTRSDPAHQNARSERCEAVRGLLHQLPETMRKVCVMFYLGDASCKQVAAALGMTETAVKVNLHRARKRLLELGAAAWRYA